MTIQVSWTKLVHLTGPLPLLNLNSDDTSTYHIFVYFVCRNFFLKYFRNFTIGIDCAANGFQVCRADRANTVYGNLLLYLWKLKFVCKT